MTNSSIANIVLLVTLFVFDYAGAEEDRDPLTQLKACAQITDTVERIACYESLGKQVLAADRAAETMVETTEPPAPAAVASAKGIAEPPGRVSKSAAAPVVVEQTVTVAPPRSPSLPDDIGGGQFEEIDAEDIRQERGQVISCRHDPNYNYSFVFDNGQVWRQTDGRRFRKPKDCQFTAIITRDGLGYKMQVDGKKYRYRVKRIR